MENVFLVVQTQSNLNKRKDEPKNAHRKGKIEKPVNVDSLSYSDWLNWYRHEQKVFPFFSNAFDSLLFLPLTLYFFLSYFNKNGNTQKKPFESIIRLNLTSLSYVNGFCCGVALRFPTICLYHLMLCVHYTLFLYYIIIDPRYTFFSIMYVFFFFGLTLFVCSHSVLLNLFRISVTIPKNSNDNDIFAKSLQWNSWILRQ